MDTRQIEGYVTTLRYKSETQSGKAGVLKLNDQDEPYFFYSDELLDEASVQVGDAVRLTLAGNVIKKAEKTGLHVAQPASRQAQLDDSKAFVPASRVQAKPSEFRSPEQIIRTEAARIVLENSMYRTDDQGNDIGPDWKLMQELEEYIANGKIPERPAAPEKSVPKRKEVKNEVHD